VPASGVSSVDTCARSSHVGAAGPSQPVRTSTADRTNGSAAQASPALTRLVEDVATGLRRAIVADLEGPSSEVVNWITARLDRARLTLAEDAALRQDLDGWLKERVTEAVDRYHDRIARFIERGVHALGPEGAVRLIEEHAGDDLQYIRVNGTVVGGLAGGGLYAIHLLLGLLG